MTKKQIDKLMSFIEPFRMVPPFSKLKGERQTAAIVYQIAKNDFLYEGLTHFIGPWKESDPKQAESRIKNHKR